MTPLARLYPRFAGADRRRALLAACLAATALIAGCGSVGAPPGGSPAASPTATGVTVCGSRALTVNLDSSAVGVAGGSSYVPLEFTNASPSSCTLPAYPWVSFASGLAGRAIGSPAKARGRHGRSLVLAPGGVAHAWLQIANVADYPAGRCKPVQAGGLRVSLTGSTATAAFLTHSFQACAKAMHGSEVLAVFPVQPGQAQRGTAP
jgi:uncharacterized protein DUF4232